MKARQSMHEADWHKRIFLLSLDIMWVLTRKTCGRYIAPDFKRVLTYSYTTEPRQGKPAWWRNAHNTHCAVVQLSFGALVLHHCDVTKHGKAHTRLQQIKCSPDRMEDVTEEGYGMAAGTVCPAAFARDRLRPARISHKPTIFSSPIISLLLCSPSGSRFSLTVPCGSRSSCQQPLS